MLGENKSAQPQDAPRNWTYSPRPALEQAITDIRRKHAPLRPAGLQHTLRLMRKLGDPHLRLPPVFHVAGTNGKGSSLAFLQAAFEAGGMKVHKFISPHLVHFEERIIVGGRMIDADLLLDLIHECDRAAGDDTVSFFEFFTALAFLAYTRSNADAVLLETGLGGLYDSTNVVEKSVAMLTRISFDHMRLLGDTLPDIARNKAGIIKKSCPVIIAPQPDAGVMDVFRARAQEMDAPVFAAGEGWSTVETADGFEYRGRGFSGRLPRPRLLGAHQVINAGTAIAALEQSEFRQLVTHDTLARAMENVEWQGRLQQLKKGYLADLLPPGWELWVDGAHNDSGAEVLAQQVAAWGDDKPPHIITGFKRKKEPDNFYARLAGVPRTIQAVEAEFDAPMMSAPELCEYLAKAGFSAAAPAPNLESAIKSLTFQFQSPQRIIITGSLYLVGHALKINGAS